MSIEQTRRFIIDDPVKNMSSWTVAAFDPTKGELPRRDTDPRGMELYFKALADAGAPGILIASSTGWGHARTFEEHKSNVITAGKLEITNCIKQVLLRIEDPIEKNRDLLETIKSLDYGIIWTRRGSHIPPDASDEETAKQMFPLVKAAAEKGLPVGIYSISTVDGAPLRSGTGKILLEMLGDELAENLVAVKITEPDYENSTLTYLREKAFQNKKIVQGWDEFYARALQEGMRSDGTNQCGATSGAAACMVYAYKEMYEAAEKKDWQELSGIQEVVSRVFYSMQGPDKTKFPDLQIAKWVMGLGHPLTEQRTEKDAQKLLGTLRELSIYENSRYLKRILDSFLIMEEYPNYRSPVYKDLKSCYGKQRI